MRMLPFGAKLFVWSLHPRVMRNWIIAASEKSNPGIWGGLLCRKRHIDEKLLASREEIDAIVNLGAGFDTRVYRLKALSGVLVWEVDQKQNIDAKGARLRSALGQIPPNVKLVALDFDREQLGAALAREGYSASKPTFFIWEAVAQYLTEQAVRATFGFLATAAKGSRLTSTYVHKDFLEGKALFGWAAGHKRFVATKLWLFGLTPETCPEFLSPYGWRVIEDVSYEELGNRYLAPTGRRLTSTPVERMVYAEKI